MKYRRITKKQVYVPGSTYVELETYSSKQVTHFLEPGTYPTYLETWNLQVSIGRILKFQDRTRNHAHP